MATTVTATIQAFQPNQKTKLKVEPKVDLVVQLLMKFSAWRSRMERQLKRPSLTQTKMRTQSRRSRYERNHAVLASSGENLTRADQAHAHGIFH